MLCAATLLATTLLALAPARAQPAAAVHDGRWWLSLQPAERLGYSYGMIDCLADTTLSYQQAADRVTASVAASPAATSSIQAQFRSLPARIPTPAPAALDSQARSDGLLWLQTIDRPAQQTGYVEGAIDCASAAGKARYSAPPATYVGRLTAWYGMVPDPDSPDAARESTLILTALHHLRDGAPAGESAPPQAPAAPR